MKQNKAYKFRIYPNEEQKIIFAKTFGCTRFIYNKMLSDKIDYYQQTKQRLNNTPAQYKTEFEWLKEVDSLALANAQMNLQKAFTNFFTNPKSGFPKFKSKHKNRKSYTTNNQRKDFLHRLSRQIANTYDCVCIEDLDMKAMSQALNFGKSVADNGWGMFTTFLKYKLEDLGKQLIKIDKWFPSSKTCSNCGNVKENLSLSDRIYHCNYCGITLNRDYNASMNIKNQGMKLVIS